MKQTLVEWLFEKLWETPKDKFTWHSILEQAKQMEKEQSIAELRHKDGTPMRKYNSPKLQEIEMENKQTAVEWLAKEIWKRGPIGEDTPTWLKELYEQAKQMEKAQIKDAWNSFDGKTFEQYYNETFKSE